MCNAKAGKDVETNGNLIDLLLNSPDPNRNKAGTQQDNADPQMAQGLVYGRKVWGCLIMGDAREMRSLSNKEYLQQQLSD